MELVSYTTSPKTYQSVFFTLTMEQAQKYGPYDIIIVGSGIGGGVLAGDFFDTNVMLGKDAKKVLVIERGGLVFHSHCLNGARPSGLYEDHGQQNQTFFSQFRKEYTLHPDMTPDEVLDWKGGPVHCLGGRSAVWGLFAPRIHQSYLDKYLSEPVRSDLCRTYYRLAETLMDVLTPSTKPVHRELMEYLNSGSTYAEVQWQWGRIASDFEGSANFEFSSGAYSTIDKLLEIAMSKPVEEGKVREHDHFKILLDCEVRSLTWDETATNTVSGVLVRAGDGREDTICVTRGGAVVLCAGSVGSPTILLRSGVDIGSPAMGGLHLTDHDILFKSIPFQYNNRNARPHVGAMKLQSYVTPRGPPPSSHIDPSPEVVLANISVDASSFLPRGDVIYDNTPKWTIVFVRATDLNSANTIELVNDEPVVKIVRAHPAERSFHLDLLRCVAEEAKATTAQVLNAEFLDSTSPAPQTKDNYFNVLELGGVAHELGTVPMKQADETKAYCLNDDLSLRDHKGVYVCDLSVFPFSPEVNPTLTLAALALRLSRTELHRRDPFYHTSDVPDSDTVYVVNHSGRKIKIWLGNRGGAECDSEECVLVPGEMRTFARRAGVAEALSVFRLSGASNTVFSKDPETLSAPPGRLTAILQNTSTHLLQAQRPFKVKIPVARDRMY